MSTNEGCYVVRRQFSRNEEGLWYRIMQQNKWRARLEAQQQQQRQVAIA